MSEVYLELMNTVTEAMEGATEAIGQFTEALTHTPDAMGIVIKIVKLQNIVNKIVTSIRDEEEKKGLQQIWDKLELEREKLETDRKELRQRIDSNHKEIDEAFRGAAWDTLVARLSNTETMYLLDETWKPLRDAVHDVQSRFEGWDKTTVDLLCGDGIFDRVALVVKKVDALRDAAENGSIDQKYVEISEFVMDLERLPSEFKVVLN